MVLTKETQLLKRIIPTEEIQLLKQIQTKETVLILLQKQIIVTGIIRHQKAIQEVILLLNLTQAIEVTIQEAANQIVGADQLGTQIEEV